MRARFVVTLSILTVSFACASPAHAAEAPRTTPATLVRLWLEPPLAGFTLGFGDSPRTTFNPHFGALAVAAEFSNLFTVEAGAGALLSFPGGEVLIAPDADAWLRGGIAPVLHRGGDGWVLQISSALGYRYMARSKIVYEDYGVDSESVNAVALDVGPVMTHASARGTGFSLRLLTGVIVPITHSHSRHGYMDFPPSRLDVAVPVGFSLGWAF